jgi:hypothetical protein
MNSISNLELVPSSGHGEAFSFDAALASQNMVGNAGHSPQKPVIISTGQNNTRVSVPGPFPEGVEFSAFLGTQFSFDQPASRASGSDITVLPAASSMPDSFKNTWNVFAVTNNSDGTRAAVRLAVDGHGAITHSKRLKLPPGKDFGLFIQEYMAKQEPRPKGIEKKPVHSNLADKDSPSFAMNGLKYKLTKTSDRTNIRVSGDFPENLEISIAPGVKLSLSDNVITAEPYSALPKEFRTKSIFAVKFTPHKGFEVAQLLINDKGVVTWSTLFDRSSLADMGFGQQMNNKESSPPDNAGSAPDELPGMFGNLFVER